jgi:hypothetical protein
MADKRVYDWLHRGGPWHDAPRTIETHAAYVFLVGDRAYKMKMPVNLGYLDFTSLEQRHAALSRELVLNARTAPATYLKLVPVVETGRGLALGGEGTVVEWLLEMRRFDDNALLADLADRGELPEATVEALAAHAARFHDRAEAVPDVDWPEAVARIARENTADLTAQQAAFPEHALARAMTARRTCMESCARALAHQSADVRRCHGDMHLGNAFVDRGAPTLFDCIEFDDFYATIPPLYDVAFLLMDLISRGMPRHANRALNAWIIHRAPQHWPAIMASLAALPLYLALRAEIRAKTEGRRPGGGPSAKRYLGLVESLLACQPPQLIAIGGLSGTGKSLLAKAIAWQVGGGAGAVHLRTDEIRKRLANIPLDAPLPPSAYTQAASDGVYARLVELAQGALAAGSTVVLDAVFAREIERASAAAVGHRAGVRFTGLWLEASPDILLKRLNSRVGDVSDADEAVLRRQLTYDVGTIDWHRIDSSHNAEQTAREALACVRRN